MSKSSTYEQHPLAQQYVPGSMPDEEFDALCDDMRKRGQRIPIMRFEGKILDGMNRYRACLRNGADPVFDDYEGDDPSGLVIALNVLRRKLGATQRALAGARLCLNFSITQDEASKRVGVSKVHINLVVQALNSKNARILKMLENPELTRAQLHEDLVQTGIVRVPTPAATPQPVLSAAGASNGLNEFFNKAVHHSDEGAESEGGADEVDLDDILGDPPSAGGRVLELDKSSKTAGGMPVVGSKPGHPERRSKDTPASQLAERFKAMGEADQVSFIQLTWHIQRKLLSVAGVQVLRPGESAAAEAAKIASDALAAASGPAKGPRSPRATRATAKAE